MSVDHPAEKTVPAQRRLVHGTIVHGAQLLSRDAQTPTTYFTRESGAGILLSTWTDGHPRRVGIIGLGVGTLAAYGRPGDVFRFYEISPLVLRFAEADFSFLAGSRARVETTLGDARLVLEQEQPQQFDVLIVDAFSSDSIPTHLLTLEAFRLYFRHLKPAGVLAVHISNLYLDLEPVVATAARTNGRSAVIIRSPSRPERAQVEAVWALIGLDETLSQCARCRGASTATRRRIRPWTDDYSSVLAVIR